MINFEEFEDLKEYVKNIKNIPPITSKEEKVLMLRVLEGDEKAKQRLAEAHLLLVLDVIDEEVSALIQNLVQEGNVGLFRAVEKYNPNLNINFKDYARSWIQWAIKNFLKKI